jgi:hypothetical protein
MLGLPVSELVDMKRFEKELISLKKDKGIALSLAVIAGLGVVYAIWHKRHKNTKPQLRPQQIGEEKFDLSYDGITRVSLLFGAGQVMVLANGKRIGKVFRSAVNEQWQSDDQAVWPHLDRINDGTAELSSRQNFSQILKGNFAEILATEWKSTETLEVILKPEVDTVAFSKLLKAQVDKLIGFPRLLDLVVKRIDNPYFIIVRLNTKPGLSPIGES